MTILFRCQVRLDLSNERKVFNFFKMLAGWLERALRTSSTWNKCSFHPKCSILKFIYPIVLKFFSELLNGKTPHINRINVTHDALIHYILTLQLNRCCVIGFDTDCIMIYWRYWGFDHWHGLLVQLVLMTIRKLGVIKRKHLDVVLLGLRRRLFLVWKRLIELVLLILIVVSLSHEEAWIFLVIMLPRTLVKMFCVS